MSTVVCEKKLSECCLSDLFNTELSVENKRLKSIKNRNQDTPDVRMATEQVKSSLFPAKLRLCWC
jgi:hypothetical protein